MRVPVTFLPSGATAWVAPGITVVEASRAAGVPVAAPCGGRGVCGTCGVRVVEGRLSEPAEDELQRLSRAPAGVRLACRASIVAPVTLKPIVSHSGPVSRAKLHGTGPFAAGVDLGTTSVSAVVIDCATGLEAGRVTVANRQASHGADVMSRIGAAMSGAGEELQRAAEDSVIDALTAATGSATERLDRVVIAGNSAMAALLCGGDASGLSQSPYEAPEASSLAASEGLRAAFADGANVDVVPPIASFVGGDVLAGIVSVGLVDSSKPAMLVDVGTNAEVALWTGSRLVVTSAAAGPAFEAGGLGCSGPAVPGAVTSVQIAGSEVRLRTIGAQPPTWLSGAGVVSAFAALRRAGHLDAGGLLIESGPLSERLDRDDAGVLGVRLGEDPASIRLSQTDVRAVQLAKAAVRVAVVTTLAAGDVRGSDLAVLHLAGAFGAALEVGELADIGMLPTSVVSVVTYAGNTALAGAVVLACDRSAEERAVALAAAAEHVALAEVPGFNDALMGALALEASDS